MDAREARYEALSARMRTEGLPSSDWAEWMRLRARFEPSESVDDFADRIGYPTVVESAGTYRKHRVRGHDVWLRFFYFDQSKALSDEAYEREHMTAHDYGWMVYIDGTQRMGVFPKESEALKNARELVRDLEEAV